MKISYSIKPYTISKLLNLYKIPKSKKKTNKPKVPYKWNVAPDEPPPPTQVGKLHNAREYGVIIADECHHVNSQAAKPFWDLV